MVKMFPLRIDEDLHKKLKVLAAENDTYVNTLIIEAIISSLKKDVESSDEKTEDNIQSTK